MYFFFGKSFMIVLAMILARFQAFIYNIIIKYLLWLLNTLGSFGKNRAKENYILVTFSPVSGA